MKKMKNIFSHARVNVALYSILACVIVVVLACSKSSNPSSSSPTQTSGGFNVTSASVATPPVVDGDGSDNAWSSAQWTTIHMEGFSGVSDQFDVQLKSVHTATDVYFLVQYPDATEDDIPNKLVFNGGDPANPSNWTNTSAGQDGFSFMWDMMLGGKSARDPGGKFTDSTYGCTAACHTTHSLNNLESGMFPDSGEVDIWYWNAGTTNPQGYADDQYAVGADNNGTGNNSTRGKDGDQEKQFADANYSIGTPTFPDNVAGGTNDNLDITKFLWGNSSMQLSATNPMTSAPWKTGDYVPGWALSTPNVLGGEADVQAKGVHANGNWTIEFKRQLQTLNSSTDVEFSTANSYAFSIAVHNNVRKYADWQYAQLSGAPQPPHYGCVPRSITLKFQ
jgi:hypothetical protein